MPRWFLSYHSPDQSLAQRVKSAIECKDSASRVFFAPTHLRAGGAWTDQLAQELAEADAFILLVGAAGVGKWQVPEYDEALDRWVKSGRTFPLIVVLLEGQTAPGLPFLRQLHWIVTPDPASEKDVARIFDAASGRGACPSELWRYAAPYRGLEAMEEKDSDYFFGRTRETIETLDALQAQGRLPVLIGNSGVGKSSLAQAGVLAALKRQAWPGDAGASKAWPAVFQNSRRWCFLTLRPGGEPLKALVDCFLDAWQFEATDPKRVERQQGWIELLQGKAKLADLIDATERRRAELNQPKPPAFFLYVDQGEELYARAEEHERRRFSELLGEALADPRLRAMMSMRSDFYGSLQSDAPLFRARLQIDVPPLGEDELREVVSRPAQLLGARFESDRLTDIIARRAAEDSVKDVGALPLLSYTLDDIWSEMLKAGDGVLRLPAQSFEVGGVLVERANRFLAEHPGAEDALKRVLTLKLATVRADGEPTRRRASRDEFSDEEWRLVSELSGYPNRLLVTATTEAGETYAEVAHEAIFRRWGKLREWIAAEREFLAWRSGLETARRVWAKTPDQDKIDALLLGFALKQAQSWLAERKAEIPKADQDFIVQSGSESVAAERQFLAWRLSCERARDAWEKKADRDKNAALLTGFALTAAQDWLAKRSEDIEEAARTFIVESREAQRRQRRSQSLVGAVIATMVLVAATGWGQDWLKYGIHALASRVKELFYVANATPLNTAQERALKSGDTIKECRDCPEMIVVAAGRFLMGSREGQGDDNERPQREVTIARPFAVAKFDLTFAEWDACAAHGDCALYVSDGDWGRGRRLGDQRELGRRADLPEMAVQDHRQAISAAVRGGIRICGARRKRDGISLGKRDQVGWQGDGQLRRLRQPMGQ